MTPSSTGRSCASGCARRVSVKRRSSTSLSQSRNSRRVSRSCRARKARTCSTTAGRAEAAGAYVDAQRQRLGVADRRSQQIVDQEQRQIVDGDVAVILQRIERRGTAGAGETGDQHHRPARRYRLAAARRRLRLAGG